MGYEGIPNNIILLLLIQFALGGKAREWLDMLPPDTKRNIPTTIVLIVYKRLFDFKQGSTKTLGQAWERFERILRCLIGNGVKSATQL